MFRRSLSLVLVFCALGCSQPQADKPAATTSESDVVFTADLAPIDTDKAPDIVATEIAKSETSSAICPGGSGCACLKPNDCDNALCIEDPNIDGGLACATKCISDCPSGYACAPVTAAGGDITTICVPKFIRLCDPCAVSKDCEALGLKDSACVDQGALGRFCGTSCGDAGDCPKDFACQEVPTAEGGKLKQCVRLPDDGSKLAFGTCPCSAKAVAKKLATACYIEAKGADGKVAGKCSGTRACESKGLSGCSAPPAVAEICDGLDNDCNGQTDEASCDDKNACTTDVCDGKGGCGHSNKSGSACDADGSVCTENDVCKDGVCVAGAVKECEDKNLCTSDSCDMAKGCTQVADDGKPCDADGNLCTQGDVCAGGTCKAGADVACDDKNACTSDGCDKKTGQCTASALDDGIPCDDGTKCTDKDACKGGSCKGKAVGCDDGNPCTDDVCDSKLGCQITKLSGAPCDDDNLCTIGDLCQNGECQPGSAKNCVSPDACYISKCNLVDGKCKVTEAAAGANCDDGNACTSGDGCKSGNCTGVVKACDDGNPCTDDGCAAKTGCTSLPAVKPCDDGNLCTDFDGCKGGACVGLAKTVTVECNDQNPCTADGCDAKVGCTHAAMLGGCEDGNGCTQGDTCQGGICVAGNNSCGCQSDADCAVQEDGDLCNGTLFCDKAKLPYVCKVSAKTVIVCDVSGDTACSATVCAAKTGICGKKAADDGKPCDADGSVCTDADACKSGMCGAGVVVGCNDKNPCTTDSCDAKLGCVHAANAQACDADGDACTVGDGCSGKVCLAGAKKVCDDGELCTVDSCDKSSGVCVFSGLAMEGKACDADGSVCTVGDACGGGKCAIGKAKNCDDGNVCTDDGCDAKLGCKAVANAKGCDDGDGCTLGDACGAGACEAGAAKVCGGTDVCLAGVCKAGPLDGMVLIPGGVFNMGCVPSDPDCFSDEKPQHAVTLDAFYMDIYEVSAAKYKACVDAGKCTKPDSFDGCSPSKYGTFGANGKEQHPVNCVTWTQGDAYCKWKDGKGHLPTEGQWEKAARGGLDGKKFPWGEAGPTCTPGQSNTAVWYENKDFGCDTGSTFAVGAGSSKNGYGLYDMAGNVGEWTADWYGSGYYAASPGANPVGPASGSERVNRGGSFSGFPVNLRASFRWHMSPSGDGTGLGFRCARSFP